MTDVNARWASRAFFAEVAEVLGVNTDQIMAHAVLPPDGRIIVYFTAEPTEEVDLDNVVILSAQLRRDADGILLKFGETRECPGMWEEIKRSIDAANDPALGAEDAMKRIVGDDE